MTITLVPIPPVGPDPRCRRVTLTVPPKPKVSVLLDQSWFFSLFSRDALRCEPILCFRCHLWQQRHWFMHGGSGHHDEDHHQRRRRERGGGGGQRDANDVEDDDEHDGVWDEDDDDDEEEEVVTAVAAEPGRAGGATTSATRRPMPPVGLDGDEELADMDRVSNPQGGGGVAAAPRRRRRHHGGEPAARGDPPRQQHQPYVIVEQGNRVPCDTVSVPMACVLVGDALTGGLLPTPFPGCCSFALGLQARFMVRLRYHIAGAGMHDALAVGCCAPCAARQQAREIELQMAGLMYPTPWWCSDSMQ